MHQTTSANPSSPATTRHFSVRRGFSLVEILVVIGIISLLVALLLPALSKVLERAKATTTLGTMQEFAKACDAYFHEFGEYPGVIPETYLQTDTGGNDGTAPRISSTENAILALMGGYRVPSDEDYGTYPGTVYTFGSGPSAFVIKINPSRIGEGPYRNGRRYDSFYSPKGREFSKTTGQMVGTELEAADSTNAIPDLLDAWGNPIIFIRQSRGLGQLVGDASSAQFTRAGILPYTLSTSLGERNADQTLNGNPGGYSILNTASAAGLSGSAARDRTLGQIIRHPAKDATNLQNDVGARNNVDAGVPRGKYFLISAGPDGVYYSAAQGRGTPSAPQGDIVGYTANPDGPRVIDSFDDILLPGGS